MLWRLIVLQQGIHHLLDWGKSSASEQVLCESLLYHRILLDSIHADGLLCGEHQYSDISAHQSPQPRKSVPPVPMSSTTENFPGLSSLASQKRPLYWGTKHRPRNQIESLWVCVIKGFPNTSVGVLKSYSCACVTRPTNWI
ncbi:hypothetical protein JTB14_022323 [Gonioctena quinquepunctata]|nr:hypothetical protein JTB14_022323 [Gonioctena quinquepunctata]